MTILVRHYEVEKTGIEINSSDWYDWLSQVNSFRYECEYGGITLVKDNQYWTAIKKVDGRLRRKRAGKNETLDRDRLRSLTALLCINGCWTEYLRAKNLKERESTKGLKRRIEFLEKKLGDREKEIADLKEKLLSVTQNRL